MLIFDGGHAGAIRIGEYAQRSLPLGIPVISVDEIADLTEIGLTPSDVTGNVCWIRTDGRPERGHRAAAAMLVAVRKPWSPLAAAALTPPGSWIAARGFQAFMRGERISSSAAESSRTA